MGVSRAYIINIYSRGRFVGARSHPIMTIVGCKSTKFSGNSKEKEGKIYIFVQITLCNKNDSLPYTRVWLLGPKARGFCFNANYLNKCSGSNQHVGVNHSIYHTVCIFLRRSALAARISALISSIVSSGS